MRRMALAMLVGLGGCHAAPAGQPATWPTRGWPVARPAEVGLDSAALAGLDHEIAAGKYRYVDGMFVTRHGKQVFQAVYRHDYAAVYGGRDTVPGMYNYYDPAWHPFYHGSSLHTLQSVTKSITSLVLGVAISRGQFGSIDSAVTSFFPTRTIQNLDDRKRRMTVRHLLTMTAGLDWDESTVTYTDPRNNCAVMEASRDWVQYVLDRPMADEPGSTWVYNSGATELLAEIFQRATGQDLATYAEANLFHPLGITRYYWKRTPLGLPDTEGGLYLESPDLAKIGLLMQRGGRWDGTRIVSADWVQQSVTPAMDIGRPEPGAPAPLEYGFKWWLVPYGQGGTKLAWAGNGYGGQRLLVLPDEDIVAVFTGWNIDENPPLPMREMTERLAAAAR